MNETVKIKSAGPHVVEERGGVVFVDGVPLRDNNDEIGIAKLQAMVLQSVNAEKREKKFMKQQLQLMQMKTKGSNAKPVTSKKGQKRNTPCACGSGLKFKKCCLKKGGD